MRTILTVIIFSIFIAVYFFGSQKKTKISVFNSNGDELAVLDGIPISGEIALLSKENLEKIRKAQNKIGRENRQFIFEWNGGSLTVEASKIIEADSDLNLNFGQEFIVFDNFEDSGQNMLKGLEFERD